MRSKRSAAAPLSSARATRVGGVLAAAGERQQLGRERQRDRAQAGLLAAPGQKIDRLAHLQRVAGGAAEALVHVGEQGRAAQPGAVGDLDQTGGEVARCGQRRQEGAGADLDVHDQRVEAGGELLRQDRG